LRFERNNCDGPRGCPTISQKIAIYPQALLTKAMAFGKLLK